jgi:hypothetical protein
MLRVWLLVGLCQGCSFAWHDTHRRASPISESHCPSYAGAVLDTIGAGAFAFVASEAYLHRNDTDSAAGIFVMPLAGAAIAYAISADYGFVEAGRCDREVAEKQRIHAREEAWSRMRGAAEAARRGDCASVRTASEDVRAIDSDFHATVFVRDVAIARCLAP